MTDGSLTATSYEYVGNSARSALTQSGGTNSVAKSVYLGYNPGSIGSYNLSSSGQLTATTEYVGDSGTGSFAQSSGTNSITNTLYLGGLREQPWTYNLSGIGQLSAMNEYVDYAAGERLCCSRMAA